MFAKLSPKKSSEMASNFPSHYKVHEVLGKGAFGTVKRCMKKTTGEEFAVKIINKRLAKTEIEHVLEEVEICRKVKHPNVVRLHEIFDQIDDFYLVFDLVVGGELMHDIETRNLYSEYDASKCMEQILGAINYCHKMDVVHRDLKPENILLASKMRGAAIKIADFGLAVEVDGNQVDRFGVAGTPIYMAPEALEDNYYGKPVDVWACGVILYLLLFGSLPFSGEDIEPIRLNILRGIKYPADRKDTISKNAKDTIHRMLTIDPRKRITAGEALKHPWIGRRQQAAPKRHLDQTIVHLKKFNARRKFKAGILAAVAVGKLLKKMPTKDSKKSDGVRQHPTTQRSAETEIEPMKDPQDEMRRKQEIIELTQDLIDACNVGDSRAVAKLCDRHVTTFDSNGSGNIVEGRDFYKLIFGSSAKIELLDPCVHLLGNDGACIAYYRSTEYISRSGYLQTEEIEDTVIWHKVGGNWKVVHFHSGLSFEINN